MTGVWFEDSRQEFVAKRLVELAARESNDDIDTLLQEFDAPRGSNVASSLVHQLTIHETYFFREEYQFNCLIRDVLPRVEQASPRGPLRFWTVPCSTGEEPYSLALVLLSRWSRLDVRDVDIFASDIDWRSIEAAMAGRYSPRSVQNVPPELLSRYFRKVSQGFEIDREITRAVRFSPCNLANPASVPFTEVFDVVFCRNLLIYFDVMSRQRAFSSLHRSLRPGGYLFLGHAESAHGMPELFEPKTFSDAVVYQKLPLH